MSLKLLVGPNRRQTRAKLIVGSILSIYTMHTVYHRVTVTKLAIDDGMESLGILRIPEHRF